MMRKIKLIVLGALAVTIVFTNRAYLKKAWIDRLPFAHKTGTAYLRQADYGPDAQSGPFLPLTDPELRARAVAAAGAKAVELGFDPASMKVTIDDAGWDLFTSHSPDFTLRHKDQWEKLQGKNFLAVHFLPQSGKDHQLWVFVDTKYYTVLTWFVPTLSEIPPQ
ncbi:MAG: hypothetical protein ACM3OC_08005 [Deltaproteobacteria bacterium]